MGESNVVCGGPGSRTMRTPFLPLRQSLRDCAVGALLIRQTLMSEAASLPTVPVMRRIIDADTVYAALGEPARRRILVALFDGQPRRAKTLSASAGKRFEATLAQVRQQ